MERDRAGGHAAAERELIRASGLLNITTPRAYGGGGQPWARFYRSLRRIAQADSALAFYAPVAVRPDRSRRTCSTAPCFSTEKA